jgi:hypothetical protein
MKIGIRCSFAVMVLALLGAGCAGQPQQAGQPASVAATAPAAPAAANDDDAVECEDTVSTGTMIQKQVCYSASQKAQQQQDAAALQAQTRATH